MPNLCEQFISSCQQFSDQEAMRIKMPNGWDIYSYKDLFRCTSKVAQWLKDRELNNGDRVAIILDNSPYWSMIYFGIIFAGGIAVPLDPQANQKDVEVLIKDAGIKFVFVEDRLKHYFDRIFLKQNTIVIASEQVLKDLQSFDDVISSRQSEVNLKNITPQRNDTASIIYTSGTTSDPKGVELTHDNLISNFESIKQMGIVSQKDTFISILPLFHAYAFMSTLLLPLFSGAKIVYPKTLKSRELVEVMQETKVTMLVGVPGLLLNIHNSIISKIKELSFLKQVALKALTVGLKKIRNVTGFNVLKGLYGDVHKRFGGHLRYLVSGGARLEPQMAKDFASWGFSVLEGYGLTETSPIVTLTPPEKIKSGSVGKPISGVKVRIDSPDASGVGEVAICGPNVMKGYYQKPQETSKVIRDGCFYSGDLGYFDNDGYLFLSGRSKEMIVLPSGKNIFPEEIETAYLHASFIKEIAVFMPQKGPQQLKAMVVPDFDAFKKSGDVNIEEKIRFQIENISKELASYKRVHGFVFLKEDLPKTRLGKIKRYQLPLIFKGMESASDEVSKDTLEKTKDSKQHSVLNTFEGKKVVELLKKECSLEKSIKSTDHLELDLGIDSLLRVELVAAIEKEFSIRLSDEETALVQTVGDVVENIIEKVQFKGSSLSDEGVNKDSWSDILFDECSQEAFNNIVLDQGVFSRLISHLLKPVIGLVFKLFFQMKVEGREHLPQKGPFIICCNHTSYLDAFIVIAGLGHQLCLNTYFIGTKNIFLHPAVRWAMKIARLIAIDSASQLVKAMQLAGYIIRNKKVLCIFPEGQRSIDGKVKPFKKGIGILAKELKVPIVPVAVSGAFEAWPRTSKFPKCQKISIVFGEPMEYYDLLKENAALNSDDYQSITEALHKKVVCLHKKG